MHTSIVKMHPWLTARKGPAQVTGWVKPGWETPVGTWLMGTAGALVGMTLLGGSGHLRMLSRKGCG